MFTPVILVGELEIDLLQRRVRLEGHDLHLTALELSLLCLLATSPGRTLTRDEILDQVGGPTMQPKATSWTVTSAACGQSCTTTGGGPATSPRSPAEATASWSPPRARRRAA